MDSVAAVSGSDLVADARRFAGFYAVESALFLVTGRWIERFTEPAHRVRAATWNRYHAEHLELWSARYPTVDELPPIAEVIADADVATVAAIEKPGEVAGLVLPRLAAAYDARAAHVDSRLDGPTARTLDLVRRDTAEELADLAELADVTNNAGNTTADNPALATALQRVLA